MSNQYRRASACASQWPWPSPPRCRRSPPSPRTSDRRDAETALAGRAGSGDVGSRSKIADPRRRAPAARVQRQPLPGAHRQPAGAGRHRPGPQRLVGHAVVRRLGLRQGRREARPRRAAGVHAQERGASPTRSAPSAACPRSRSTAGSCRRTTTPPPSTSSTACKLHSSDSAQPVVNYTMRLLSRRGYETVTW